MTNCNEAVLIGLLYVTSSALPSLTTQYPSIDSRKNFTYVLLFANPWRQQTRRPKVYTYQLLEETDLEHDVRWAWKLKETSLTSQGIYRRSRSLLFENSKRLSLKREDWLNSSGVLFSTWPVTAYRYAAVQDELSVDIARAMRSDQMPNSLPVSRRDEAFDPETAFTSNTYKKVSSFVALARAACAV